MESLIYQATVIAQRGLYIRRVPTTAASTPIGSLGYASKVTADRKQGGWWHLTRINGADVIMTPATGRTFAYVYRNFERPGIGVSRPTQNGSALRTGWLPETCKLLECKWIPLTRPMQEFWFALLQQSAGGTMSFMGSRKHGQA